MTTGTTTTTTTTTGATMTMTTTTARKATQQDLKDGLQRQLHADLLAAIEAAIEAGTGDWRPSWVRQLAAMPHNLTTGKPYTGGNVFLLLMAAADAGVEADGRWATYRQWAAMGAQVQRGERGTRLLRMIVSFSCPDHGRPKARCCGKVRTRRGLITFTVHGAHQVVMADGSEVPRHPDWPSVDQLPALPGGVEAAGLLDSAGVTIDHVESARAFYRPADDRIVLPLPDQFSSPGGYLSTGFHELAHATAHEDRVGRKVEPGRDGYAAEELVAELSAVLTCTQLGVPHEALELHAAYLDGWRSRLAGEGGPKALWAAITAAQKATDWVVGHLDTAALDATREAIR